MKNKSFIDCFMLMGTAFSIKGPVLSQEANRQLIEDVFTTVVTISLDIQDFIIVDHKNMEFEVTGLLSQQWVDPRLGANSATRRMAVAGQIWKPKITNVNGQINMARNDETAFWRVYSDEGDVLLSEKITLRLRCTSNFKDFPFDSQSCVLKFGSYRFPNEEMSLQWSNTSAANSHDLWTNEFRVTNVSTSTDVDTRLSGNFSVANVHVYLQRNSMHYILCTFIPCTFLNALCYFSTWLNLRRSSQRMVLNVFALGLLIIFLYISVCLTFPVPYLKSMDIFVAMCACFSTISLLETAFVINCQEVENELYNLKKQAHSQKYSIIAYWMEHGIKIGFPVFFTFFLFLFCFIYGNN